MKINTKALKDILSVIVYLIPIIFLVAVIAQYAVTITKELSVYEYQVQNFIKIEPRVTHPSSFGVAPIVSVASAKEPAEMTTEEYICHVFGNDCKLALAVSQAENGTRECERLNINTNNSLDIGVFQINTVHLKKGWKLPDLLDCHKNIDHAYEIFKAQGFTPWVAYNSGSYKKFLQ